MMVELGQDRIGIGFVSALGGGGGENLVVGDDVEANGG